MSKPTDVLHLIYQKRNLVKLIIAINLLISCIIVYFLRDSKYEAKVTIVYNEVEQAFKGNRAMDYLFPMTRHEVFINAFRSDSLFDLAVQRFALVDYFKLEHGHSSALMAREKLRENISYETEQHDLAIKLHSRNRDLADSLLPYIVGMVESKNEKRVLQNHQVTKRLTEKFLEQDTLNDPDVYKAYVQLEAAENVRYSGFETINHGVKDARINLWVLLSLIVLGNIIAFIIELQFLQWGAVLVGYWNKSDSDKLS